MKPFSLLLLACLVAPAAAAPQIEPIPEERGASGLDLALRKLKAGATFMHTAAHPDDEDNGLLVLMSRGRGLRTALLTVTRGDGGQNQIGPELFEALGILRTEELLAVHRVDGAEQYFTRAYEFGYSFSVEETFQKWGKEEILGDMVRLIRSFRPDVMVCLPQGGKGGGQHHQASARLTKEAFRAAADPRRFPEQIASGLRPWQPLKLYSRIWMEENPDAEKPDPKKIVQIDTGRYDPILGRSYNQMGREARASHLCQQMDQLRALPGEHFSRWVLEEAAIPITAPEKDLFDGVETELGRLKDFVRGEEVAAGFFFSGLRELEVQIDAAAAAFEGGAPWKTLGPLRTGLESVRNLRKQVAASSLSSSARFEIEHRLSRKEGDFVEALALAHGLGFDATADRGEVIPGSPLKVTVQITNRSPEPLEVRQIELEVPEDWNQRPWTETSARLGRNEKIEVPFGVFVSSKTSLTRPYWTRNPEVDRYEVSRPEEFGLPFSPPVVQARVIFRSGTVEAGIEKPVQYRYAGPWVGGEKQKEISILPRLSLTLWPKVVVFPVSAAGKSRRVSVLALHKGRDEADGTLRVEIPSGWNAEPAQVALRFQRENEAATVAFEVTPPDSVASGTYPLQAVASLDGKDYRDGFQTIAYHHIQTRYLYHPARSKIQALDVRVEPVRVGYIMGVGDEVPEAIRQLGSEPVMLGEKELAEGDLSSFDLILTGIRAYLNRKDLRAYNHRLLKYVEEGGTLVVQYNRSEFDEAEWGPYPAKISNLRVTVEEAPVRILEPSHPLFNFPNRITETDWKGWVQERGIYFLGKRDSRYRDLLASEDPWEYNKGEKRGILVEALYGKGRWIYCGLALFRQLPAGVPDAYKFFANLLSLPRAPR